MIPSRKLYQKKFFFTVLFVENILPWMYLSFGKHLVIKFLYLRIWLKDIWEHLQLVFVLNQHSALQHTLVVKSGQDFLPKIFVIQYLYKINYVRQQIFNLHVLFILLLNYSLFIDIFA